MSGAFTSYLRNRIGLENHYDNLPMQYMDFFSAVKIENKFDTFKKKKIIVLIYLLKTLIVGGGSNEYPQSMF